jgi:hypothetical protein
MGQNKKWSSADFQEVLQNLKSAVSESAPVKQEVLGQETFLGMQKLHEALTNLEIAADHFEADGNKDDAASIRAAYDQLKVIKDGFQQQFDAELAAREKALEGVAAPLSGDHRMEAKDFNPFAVCNAMAKKHGWSKDKTEKCILKLKEKPGATYEELGRL